MAEDTEEFPIADNGGVPPVLTAPMPPGSFRIGRRDPLTGQEQVTTGFAAPRPPTDPRAELFRRQAASNEALWRNLQSRTANLPIAQTEQAVAAALRFQGQRQYQRMLDAGIPANEALARSAPLMFAGPRQSSLGQAAQFMRASTPAQKYHNVGGVLYLEQPDGTVKAVTGPAPPKYHPAGGVLYREGEGGKLEAATPAPVKIQNFGPTIDRIRKLEGELDALAESQKSDVPTGAIADETRNELNMLRGQLPRSRGPRSTKTGAATSGKRVRVRAPNGKTGTISESNLEAAKAAGYTEIR